MGDVQRYAYLNARLSVLAGQLLADDQLEHLLSASKEHRAQLLQVAGLDFLIQAEKPRPELLEQGLIAVLLDEYTLVLRSLSGSARSLLMYWMRRFEMSNLKVIIRGKIAGHRRDVIAAQLVDLGRFTTLPLDDLLRTEDIVELERYLEQSAFVHIARDGRQTFAKGGDLFAFDATLEGRYFNGLTRLIDGLDFNEREKVHALMGAIIDQMNLVWLLRYRFAYGMAPAEVYYLLTSGGYELNNGRLKALAQLGSIEEVLRHLPVRLKRSIGDVNDIIGVERVLEAYTLSISNRMLTTTTFNLARAVAYLYLRERQLLRIHGILKGRFLQLNDADIRLATGLSLPRAQRHAG